jgi:hypothetical protein
MTRLATICLGRVGGGVAALLLALFLCGCESTQPQPAARTASRTLLVAVPSAPTFTRTNQLVLKRAFTGKVWLETAPSLSGPWQQSSPTFYVWASTKGLPTGVKIPVIRQTTNATEFVRARAQL